MIRRNLPPSGRATDPATVLGILGAFGLVFLAIALGGQGATFLDGKSFLIVFGGTLGATLVSFPIEEFRKAFRILRAAFYTDSTSEVMRTRRLLALAERARGDGVVALQHEAQRESDSFLAKGIELLADGIPSVEIRRILEIEIETQSHRHRRGAQLFQTMGNLSPAMGLLGTVIGLVEMLKSIDNSSAIGPAMAVALITTFYGSLLSNLVFLPLAAKLKNRSAEEIALKQITLEGLCCIADRVHPRIVEECLFSYIPPERRISQYQ